MLNCSCFSELPLVSAAANGMAVNHVDQIRTGGQHVAPGTQIRLESFGRGELEDKARSVPRRPRAASPSTRHVHCRVCLGATSA